MNDIQTVERIPPHLEQEGISVNQLLQNSSMPQKLVLQISLHKTERKFGEIGFESTEPDYMQLTTDRLKNLSCINNQREDSWIKWLADYKVRRKILKEEISSGYYIGKYQDWAQVQLCLNTWYLFLFLVLLVLLIIAIYSFVSFKAKKEYYTHLHELFIWNAKEIDFNHTPIYQLISIKQQALCKPIQEEIYKQSFEQNSRKNQLYLWFIYFVLITFLFRFFLIIMAKNSERLRKLLIGVHPLQEIISYQGGTLRLVYPSYHIFKNEVLERRSNNYRFVSYSQWYLLRIAREREKINKLNYCQ